MSENDNIEQVHDEMLKTKYSISTSFAPESDEGKVSLESNDMPPTFRQAANNFRDALAALEKSVEDKHYRFGQHVDDLIVCNEIAEEIFEVIGALEEEIRDDVDALHKDLNPERLEADMGGEGPKAKVAKGRTGCRCRAAKPKTAPYQHPTDEKLTWAGKGRKPKWLKDELDAGAELDEFKV